MAAPEIQGTNQDAPSYQGAPYTTGASTPPAGAPSPVSQQDLLKNPPLVSGPSLAEQVAANLAALGMLNSPLAETQKPSVIVQAPQSSNMLVILLLIGAAVLLIWYLKKHGQL